MIKLRNKQTGKDLGTLTDGQLQFLIDELEEENKNDQDYWLHRSQIEIFSEKGADPFLVKMLETALGEGDEVEVVWERI